MERMLPLPCDTGAAMDELASLSGRLTVAGAALAGLSDRVAAGEPWPLAADFGPGPEASWGPREVLAHVAEMLPFWLGEIERVLDGPAEPVAFGRVATDPIRLGTIERDRTLPLRELFGRIDAGAERYRRRLPELGSTDAARHGLHPTLGVLTVTEILERFVVRHLEDHVVQIEEILGSP